VLFVVAAEVAVLQIEALGYHAGLGLMSRPKEYPIPQGWSGYPELGAVAVLEVAVLLAAFVATSGIGSQIASGVLLLFTLGETVLLYSRTAWVAAGVVVLLGFAVAVRLHRSRRAWSLLAATAVLAAALVAGNPALRFLGANVLGRTATAAIVPEVAAPASRLHLWRETLEMIRDSPLSGVGLGNFRLVFESEYNPEVNSDGRRGVHAHNLWLHMTAELGIIGGLCVVALWVAVLRHAWRCVHAHAGFTTVAVFLALAGATVSNLTDAVPFGVAGARIQLLTWILFGLCAADQGGLPPARAVRVKKSSHGPRVPD
jgi:O-antigen ligase